MPRIRRPGGKGWDELPPTPQDTLRHFQRVDGMFMTPEQIAAVGRVPTAKEQMRATFVATQEPKRG